ncbi:MAG: site-2 protease family protein [bacterium]
MKWSFQIGKFFGIPLKVHLTFLLLLLFIGIVTGQRAGFQGAVHGVTLVILLFICVVLHELGHSLMAEHFGIDVRDIILLPIGGVSQMEKIPDEPQKELFISSIGPLISLGLALFFLITARLFKLDLSLQGATLVSGNFLVSLLWINLILGVFNLLPAFPMDGGRVLRSLLAMRMEYLKATHIAVNIGQAFAVFFFFYGLFYNFWLALIGIFIYMGAEAEEHETMLRRSLRRIPVNQAMITNFQKLSPDDQLGRAINIACHSLQMDFPVMENNSLIGIFPRDRFLSSMRDHSPETPIKELMNTDFTTISDTEPLEEVYNKINQTKGGFIPVMHGNNLSGFINLEQIGKFHMLCGLGQK